MKQEIHFCTASDGAQIAYATIGSGPPFVRVPAWLTHLDLDWKGSLWSHWFNAFTPDYQLICFDLRGCGLSDRRVREFSLDLWVRDLEAVIDSLGIESFPLLGMCQGGAIAVAYAARHPEKVSQLILYDSFSQGALLPGENGRRTREAKALLEMISVGWDQTNPAFRQLFADLLIPGATKEQALWLADVQKKTTTSECAAKMWKAFHLFDVKEEAKNVKVPTLIFHGKNDAVVPFDEGRKLAGLIPGARFVQLESGNHILLKDEPAWDHFLSETKEFVQEYSSKENAKRSAPYLSELTPREFEVLDLIATGLNNDEIAEKLFISPKTVRNHINSIFSKLNVKNRAKAIVMSREAGLGHTGK